MAVILPKLLSDDLVSVKASVLLGQSGLFQADHSRLNTVDMSVSRNEVHLLIFPMVTSYSPLGPNWHLKSISLSC